MKKLILTGTILFLGFTSVLRAQDERYIVIDKKEIKKMKKEEKVPILTESKYALKFDPLRMFTGELAFSFERKLGTMSTYEFEAGPTISEIGVFGDLGHFGYYSAGYSSRSALGGFASAAYRFYPMDGAFNGLYVSPKLKYKLKTVQYIDYTGALEDQIGGSSAASFIFNFGYQQWLTKQFSFDFYAGFGIGYGVTSFLYANSVYDGNTGTYTHEWIKQSREGANYQMNIGLKVGIGSEGKK